MDERDLTVPPQFSCEKCIRNITREYMVRFIGLKMLRSKTRARRSFFYASRHTGLSAMEKEHKREGAKKR
jgi:hypothetical protein